MKQIDGDILKDKLKALLEHYQYRDDDFAIGRTCALADAMELIDMQEKIEAIPIEVYYFITVFEKLDINEHGNPDTGSSRCWGFYCEKDTAFQAVHENWTDMEETVYGYAVIEGYHEGISHYTFFRQFFKFDRERNGYFEIDEPEVFKHYCSFSIG